MEKNISYHLKHPIRTSNKVLANPLARLALIGLFSYGVGQEINDMYNAYQTYDLNNSNLENNSTNSLNKSGLEIKLN
mgnify:CR=1 FL=1